MAWFEFDPKEPLILEALTSGAQFRQDITNAFLKVIETSGNGMILDLWFIFIVHSSSHLRGKVNSLLRKKVNQRVFDCALLNSSIIGHTAALQPHFDNMLAIANYSLRNPSKLMQSFGHELYLTMFDNFSEAYQCQEVQNHSFPAAAVQHTFAMPPWTLQLSCSSHHSIDR